MAFKLNSSDENPLWRNYMNNVKDDDHTSLKQIDLRTPWPSTSFATYCEEEFLIKLETDEEFKEKWG